MCYVHLHKCTQNVYMLVAHNIPLYVQTTYLSMCPIDHDIQFVCPIVIDCFRLSRDSHIRVRLHLPQNKIFMDSTHKKCIMFVIVYYKLTFSPVINLFPYSNIVYVFIV